MKTGRLIGSVSRLVGRLLAAAPSQLWFVVAVVVIAGIAYLLSPEDAEKLVGYSAVPLGIWFVVALFLAVFNRSQLGTRWRWVVSSLAIALAISGGMGTLAVPTFTELPFLTSDTYGGDVGKAISRWPADWEQYDFVGFDKVVAWARVALLLLVAFVVAAPGPAKQAGSGILTALIFAYAALATGAQSLGTRFEDWREKRAQLKKLRDEDRAEFEADQVAHADAEIDVEKAASTATSQAP